MERRRLTDSPYEFVDPSLPDDIDPVGTTSDDSSRLTTLLVGLGVGILLGLAWAEA